MDNQEQNSLEITNSYNVADVMQARMQRLAPRPVNLDQTGLSEPFVADLIGKHLLDGGVLSLLDLSYRLALSGPIVERVLNFMRKEARIEIRGSSSQGNTSTSGIGNNTSGDLRYALTDLGRNAAHDAMTRGGYIGPAPVPLDKYVEVANAQTVHGQRVSHDALTEAFAGTIIRQDLLDRIGPAMNSGRAVFIYGPAGTGKTYITQKLIRLFPDETLIPYAIAVNEIVIEMFDPVLHKQTDPDNGGSNLLLEQGHDPRFVNCKRPVIIVGGELTADMLELHFDPATHRYQAPLQLKANNGMFIIDDMGRQRVAPETVFNRWIVPLEEKRDYLSLGAGRHFTVPFDTVLVFSTNLHPLDLADEAFLRRIGYKIKFPLLRVEELEQIWEQFCDQNDIQCEPGVFDVVVNELYRAEDRPMLSCHPRDLLSMAVDRAAYRGEERVIGADHLRWAWHNYFVPMDSGTRTNNVPENYGERQ
jgi:predicted ATPase with chaperone activity